MPSNILVADGERHAGPQGLPDAGSTASRYGRAHWAALAILFALVVLTVGLAWGPRTESFLTMRLATRQDLPLAPVFLLLLAWSRHRPSTPDGRFDALLGRPATVAALLLFTGLAGWIGHYLVLHGYDLSRDEQMVDFDAAIFASGRLFHPFPSDWRPFADALNLRFILPIGDREAWVSAYLPVHAAFRALLGTVADPALSSPLLTAAGGYFLWRVARLLWPSPSRAPAAAVLLYAGSSQVLITGMSSFGMSMHLAANMLWLWLFLLPRRWAPAAAVLVGFLATGIHQPLFHPLFVLPFMLLLLRDRRWRLLAFYGAAYAAIALFWLAWPAWVSAHGSSAAVPIDGTSGIGFVERLSATVTAFDLTALWTMSANLLRFILWQHPLLVPLALLGGWAWRREPLAGALALGLVLPIAIMAAILPWQGHGWGYRYLHPVLGNAVLLAAFGWRRLEDNGYALGGRLVGTTALSLLLLLPLHAAMAAKTAAPFARLHAEIASAPADLVIVDAEAVPHGEDIVFNRADLANAPKLLIARFLRAEDMGRLCARGSIAFVPGPRLAPIAEGLGLALPEQPTRHFAELVRAARAARCTVNDF